MTRVRLPRLVERTCIYERTFISKVFNELDYTLDELRVADVKI
jgi:hypothetical protein